MKRSARAGCAVIQAAVWLACTMLSSLAQAQAQPQTQEVAPLEDSPIRSFFLIDQLEHTSTRYTGGKGGEDALRFNTLGWIGGDYNRIWIYTEGTKPYNGKLEDADIQVLYGRLVAPFWDLQAGVRYFKPRPGAPSRNSAVFGIQGLAPYRFEVQAAVFVTEHGEVSGRVELEYELLLTQRWILQPRFATNFAFKEVREQDIGRGVNDAELGVRLRYEITREFAPYVGLSWQSRYGGTAQFARERGERVGGLSLVAGIRAWF